MKNKNIIEVSFAPELEQAAQEKYRQDLEVLKCVGILSDEQVESCVIKAIERNNPAECIRFFLQEMMRAMKTGLCSCTENGRRKRRLIRLINRRSPQQIRSGIKTVRSGERIRK